MSEEQVLGETRHRRINANLLWNLGYRSLTRAQASDILNQMYDTLEFRVGTRLAEQMTDAQMGGFQRAVSGMTKQSGLDWLQNNFPNYRAVVNEEFEHIIRTLKHAATMRDRRAKLSQSQSR